MEVCPATPLLSRSSAVPIHWHSGFRVQRRQDHQLHGVFSLMIPHQVIVLTRNNCAHCAQRQRRSNARCHHANRLQNDVLYGHRLETLHACLHGAHKCQAHATVLILDDSLFQLEDTCGRFLSDKLAVSLKCPRCCCCCCSCCGCCCCTCVLRQVQYEVQSVLTALSSQSVCLSSLPFLPFCLFS